MTSASELPRLGIVTPALARLDCLEWPAGLAIDAYGVRVGIRATSSGLLESLLARLPIGWRTASSPLVDFLFSALEGPGHRYEAYVGGLSLASTPDADEMLERFEEAVHLRVAEFAKTHVFLHAGVVGWNGRAIVLPGRSMSGKTTLVREFLRAGADYLSDEYAVLDASGNVHPFPRPLAVRVEGTERPRRYRAEEIGAIVAPGPLRVGSVLLATYDQGAEWSPRRLSPGEAVIELFKHAFAAKRSPGRLFDALGALAASATTLAGSRAEAKKLVASILGETR